LKFIGYYILKGEGKQKILVESFLEGAKKLGYPIESFRLSKKSKFSIDNSNTCVTVGWRKEVQNLISKYQYKITIHDAPIRNQDFHRYLHGYWCVIWNGPHKGYVYDDSLPNDRWNILKEKYQIQVLPWREKGDKIIIAHQPNRNFDGQSRYEYYDMAIKKSLETGREVLVCLSPISSGEKIKPEYEKKWKDWGCEFSVGIQDNLKDSYCMISAGGTTVSRAIFQGIPCYYIEKNITDPLNIEKDIDKFLSNPTTPDRSKWCNWIAYQQWLVSEMKEGLPLQYLFDIKEVEA